MQTPLQPLNEWTFLYQTIEEHIKGIQDYILNIYLFGSRVYQTHTPHSDWDFFVVYDDMFDFPQMDVLHQSTESVYYVIDTPLVNAKFVPFSHFRLMVYQHMHEAMQCVFAEERYKVREVRPVLYEYDFDVLRRTTHAESRRRFMKAKYTWESSQRKAKKEIVHSIRYQMFAIQIAEMGRVEDFLCANEYYNSIMEEDADWDEIEEKYSLIRKSYSAQLSTFDTYRLVYGSLEDKQSYLADVSTNKRYQSFDIFSNCPFLGKRCPNLNVVRKLTELGSKELLRESCIQIIDVDENTYFLTSNNWDSITCTEEEECYNGVFIETDSESVKIISYGINRVMPYRLHLDELKEIDWSIKIYEFLDGDYACLYYFNENWHISSQYEPFGEILTNYKQDHNGDVHKIPLNDLFWRIFKMKNYSLPSPEENNCYFFEIVSQRHLTGYDREDIFLIGVRNLDTLKEVPFEEYASKYQWNIPKSYTFNSLSELEESVENSNPFTLKGYIIHGEHFNRYSITSKGYIAMSYGSDFSKDNLFNISGELDKKSTFELVKVHLHITN
eukprot:TRINITY_DN3787_c1_g1_i1.p1 TRINITY_DN3787_c1_g1~~TRINITY_DN3787_c1_g1_i1.p1  ORF type:complete len:585 (+),score=99.27 TRINITY_DN3787_c1_g1_i1:92-1756(+)